MMRGRLPWEAWLGIFLIAASAAIYLVKFTLLHNSSDTVNYIFNALGFLPINILLVTLVINGLLSVRAQREKFLKLNMVIGTFFSEAGTHLLAFFSDHDPGVDDIRRDLLISPGWDDSDFSRVIPCLRSYPCATSMGVDELLYMRDFLSKKRTFFLRLLENPVLLEHQSFTSLLQALFHLLEELERRGEFASLSSADLDHLNGDVCRVYGFLLAEWLDYMKYLSRYYPYMFSLAVRTNPFDETASPFIDTSE